MKKYQGYLAGKQKVPSFTTIQKRTDNLSESTAHQRGLTNEDL